MKKLLPAIAFVLLANLLFAQTEKIPAIKYSVEAGLNESLLQSSIGGGTSSSYLTGFSLGAFAEFHNKHNITFQSGLLLTTKGGHYDVSQTFTSNGASFSDNGTEDINLKYIEVPFNVLLHIDAGKGKVFIGGGPYIALGISGSDNINNTQTYNGATTSSSQNNSIVFGNAAGDYKNPDYGVNVTGGFVLNKGWLLRLNWGIGKGNLDTNGNKVTNEVASFSIGYEFK